MSDEYRFDDDGAPHDTEAPTQEELENPALDRFTDEMEANLVPGDSQEEVYTVVAPREAVVHAIKEEIQAAFTRVLAVHPTVLHTEAQIALADAFLWVANNFLTRCDVETFEPNRQSMLHILGVLGTALLTATPSQEALLDAPTEGVQ